MKPSVSLLCAVFCSSAFLVSADITVLSKEKKAVLAKTLVQLPLAFERNQGQLKSGIDFVSRGDQYSIFLNARGADLLLSDGVENNRAQKGKPSAMLRMGLVGARGNAVSVAEKPLPGKINYMAGKNGGESHTGIPLFSRARYQGIYPGIDLVYYGTQRQLEYDFIVAPGGNPDQIALQFEGAEKVEIDAEGELIATLDGARTVCWHKPLVYQEAGGQRREISSRYQFVKGAVNRVQFALGSYDRSLPLVIDPLLGFSTYFGSGASALGFDDGGGKSIALDSAGNIYVAGSAIVPTTPGAFREVGGSLFAFVTKFNPAGNTLIYSTYIGDPNNQTLGYSLAVNSQGNAFLSGWCRGDGYPVKNAFQATRASRDGGWDAILTKFTADGTGIIFSTYLGGADSSETGLALAVDKYDAAYVAGMTTSPDFPLVNPLRTLPPGATEIAFLTKFNAAGSVIFSTFLGGAGIQQISGVAADPFGNAFVAGTTDSPNFPVTAGAFQTTLSGGAGRDAFVTKINSNGTAFVYSTFLGGTGDDAANAIALDTNGNAYVTGSTASTNFPTKNPIQARLRGTTNDIFITKLNSNGTALVYSTYLGGLSNDVARAIAVDSRGNAYVAGETASPDFPILNPLQSSLGGRLDAFVVKLNPAGTARLYSTFLGGASATGDDRDFANAIAVDGNGNAFVTGMTGTPDFPVRNAYQSNNIETATFVSKIVESSNLPPVITISSPTQGASFKPNDPIPVIAQVSDPDGTVTKVEFYLDDIKQGEVLSAPYNFNIGPLLPASNYVVYARATDNLGASSESDHFSISVTTNAYALPTVTLTSPSTNITADACSSVTLTATATGGDGNVTNVSIYINGLKFFERGTPPYTTVWRDVAVGTYTITAVATDDTGHQRASNPYTVTVVAPQPGKMTGTFLPDGSPIFCLAAATNRVYLIEASTNLINWTPFTNLTSTNIVLEFNDPQRSNYRYRFFRTKQLP